MRLSLVGVVLAGTLAVTAVLSGISSWQARQTLREYAAQEQDEQAKHRLHELERSAELWMRRHSTFVGDLGRHSVLIQGVMQPDDRLRELRRYLDHVTWEGQPVQLSAYDFEANPLYRRFEEPLVSIADIKDIGEILENRLQSLITAQKYGDTVWISVAAPIGRSNLPEGIIVATLPLESLRSVLYIDDLDGFEIWMGDELVERAGQVPVVQSIKIEQSGLTLRFGANLQHLSQSINDLQDSVLRNIVLSGLALVLLLPLVMRKLVARPIGLLLEDVEGIEPSKPNQRVRQSSSLAEVRSLSLGFNALLERLGNSLSELVATNNSLEERVAKRTQQLKAKNEKLGEFAYVASHDLQEPLRSIVAFADLLETKHADQLSSEAKECLRFMTDAAKRMQTLIRDLLEYSRVGTEAAHPVPIALDGLIKATLSDIEGVTHEACAVITVDPLPTVLGQEYALQQLFQNLILNGIKFRREVPPQIHIGQRPSEEPQSESIIFVRDNGIGIDPRFDKKIFDMFGRIHSRDEFEGTGIGLAICKRVAEEHDGEIWFEPGGDHGTVFCVRLPLAPDSRSSSGEAARS
ncbi:MAG: ATP-binding protein [Myxococcota bacterium]